MPVVRQEPRKVLLVGADASRDVEKQLVHADCDVLKTNTGVAAVAHVRHQSFSTAVLMSTSGEMDLTETALTLMDIQPSLEIIILMDRTPNKEMTDQVAAVVRAIPKSRILTRSDLSTYLTSSERGEGRKSARQNERHESGIDAIGGVNAEQKKGES